MLHQHPNCTTALHDFLDVIETRMLVVDARERIDAENLVHILKIIIGRSLSDIEYATHPKPLHRSRSFFHWRVNTARELLERLEIKSNIPLTTKENTGPQEKKQVNEQTHVGTTNKSRIVPHSSISRGMLLFDSMRLRFERYLGNEIDWYPLPPVNRLQYPSHTRLIWEVSKFKERTEDVTNMT